MSPRRAPSRFISLRCCAAETVKKCYFLTKRLQSAARRICASTAHKFHTCSLRSIFSDAHVAGENDSTFFAPAGANSARLLTHAGLQLRPESFFPFVLSYFHNASARHMAFFAHSHKNVLILRKNMQIMQIAFQMLRKMLYFCREDMGRSARRFMGGRERKSGRNVGHMYRGSQHDLAAHGKRDPLPRAGRSRVRCLCGRIFRSGVHRDGRRTDDV